MGYTGNGYICKASLITEIKLNPSLQKLSDFYSDTQLSEGRQLIDEVSIYLTKVDILFYMC